MAIKRSKGPTETFKFASKDGFHYPTYQAMRDANVAHNRGHLKKLGLEKASRNMRKSIRPKKKKRYVKHARMKVSETTEAPRRSNRVRKVEPPVKSVEDPEVLASLRSPKPKPRKKRADANRLTPEEREKLQNLPDWTAEMEYYLMSEENLSQPNYRSVMRQVERLVSGVGITYSRWNEGVFFHKGKSVDLSWDFDALYQDAVDFEGECSCA